MKRLWLRSLAIALLSSLALVVTACGGGDTAVSKEIELPHGMLTEAPPDLSKRPNGLACDFLKLIKKGKYAKAYGYLGVDAQNNISKDSFVKGLTEYMKTASTKKAFQAREVTSERIVGNVGIVKVTDSESSKSKAWTWEFESTYGGWKIRSLDLPPVARYQKAESY